MDQLFNIRGSRGIQKWGQNCFVWFSTGVDLIHVSSMYSGQDQTFKEWKEWEQWELPSTLSPGSPWAIDRKLTSSSLAPTVIDGSMMDYWCMPREYDMGFTGDNPYDITEEVERAKAHPHFDAFMKWHNDYFEIDWDFDWGAADGDPLEDFRAFAQWLVETGQGRYEPLEEIHAGLNGEVTGFGDRPASTEAAAEAEVIDDSPVKEELPDNQLGDASLYPTDDELEVFVGSIRYSKTWTEDLKSVMTGWDEWWRCYVRGGGFLIDFTGPHELKHVPAKSQFPLEIYYLLPDTASEWDENMDECDEIASAGNPRDHDEAADPQTGDDGNWEGDDWNDDGFGDSDGVVREMEIAMGMEISPGHETSPLKAINPHN